MSEDQLAPLDRGDGTADDLLIGAVDAAERTVATVNSLIGAVLDLESRMEDLEQTSPAGEPPPLDLWVPWLRAAYGLDHSIGQDWSSVPGAAQELAALHAAWWAAFGPDGTPRPGNSAAGWHDSLDRALPRIRSFTAGADKRGDRLPIPPVPRTPELADTSTEQ